jgi:hypothetical protein
MYYVLYRLTEQGFAASPTNGDKADLLACSADGSRVVLVRVRARDRHGWNVTAADRRPAGRNVAYVFVDLDAGRSEPSAFVLRAPAVHALLEDPSFGHATSDLPVLEQGREAWHRLGLARRSAVRSESAVSSSPVL